MRQSQLKFDSNRSSYNNLNILDINYPNDNNILVLDEQSNNLQKALDNFK